jgi:cell wall-associated NlpC family hydrolase
MSAQSHPTTLILDQPLPDTTAAPGTPGAADGGDREGGDREGGGRTPVPGRRTAPNRGGLVNRIGATALLTATVLAGMGLAPGLGSDAEAATLSGKALSIAAAKKGAPYRYGSAGPTRFDCSGLIMWSFKKAGRSLPRTAQGQYNKVRHISGKNRRAGDLVFFHSGRRVYHVGLYAGRGRIWHAPHPGARVRLEKIWTRSVWYGRAG